MSNTPPRQPHPNLSTFKVVKLETPSQLEAPKPGRRPLLKMPPLPQEMYDGMTDLEHEHFDFFLAAHQQQYPDLTPADNLALHQAGLEYISLLRMQAAQLASGELLSQSRQHPGVQLRAWLDSLSVTRKQRLAGRTGADDEDAREMKEWAKKLSS